MGNVGKLFVGGVIAGSIFGLVMFFLMFIIYDYPFKTQIQQFGYYLFVGTLLLSTFIGIRSVISSNPITFNETVDGFIYGLVVCLDIFGILHGIWQGHFELF